MPTLFEPFHRGGATAGSASGGRSLGLGLYIVQQIVLGHHGTISVESSDAAGTTFAVRLPKSEQPRA